jgi:riboflavin kinase / FMN adenylyltransferase
VRIHRDISKLPSMIYPVVTTGGFDGVHIAHQTILKRLVEAAKENDGESIVFTFSPHPRFVLYPDSEIKILNTDEEKIELLSGLNIDHLLIFPFTKEFSKTSSDDFIRNILIKSLKTKRLIIGYDHHFGNDRQGDYNKLLEYTRIYDFQIEEIAEMDVQNIAVSSTKIRTALTEGDLAMANSLLGYDYSLTGKVIKGNRIGKKLNFPTANIELDDKNKLIPAYGIYAVKVKAGDTMHYGMLYIGTRPTLPSSEFTIEVNIFDFDKEIYDEKITVYFIQKIREDKKFNSLEELRIQIMDDEKKIRKIFDDLMI